MTQVRDIMSKDFKFVSSWTSLEEAAQIMRDFDIGFLPVSENERLVGMITDRDIAVRSIAAGQDPAKTSVRSAMSPQTFYCFEDQDVDEICDNMAEMKIRRMPVVNNQKGLVGIVSLGDLSQACQHSKIGDALQEITSRGQLAKAA